MMDELKKLVKLLEDIGIKVIEYISERIFKATIKIDKNIFYLMVATKGERFLVNIKTRTFVLDKLNEIPKFILDYINQHRIEWGLC